jgi:thioredoxin reductase (NADPH)
LENALILARAGSRVVLVHRGAAFRGRPDFAAEVAASPAIEVRFGTRVDEILGQDRVAAVRLVRRAAGGAVPDPAPDAPRRSHPADGVDDLPTDAVVVKIGVAPALGPFEGQLALDEAGYVRVDAGQATSVPGVWAAGDVCNPRYSSLAAAGGQAMIAVKALAASLPEAPR